MADTKKKYDVTKADGETASVEATRVVRDGVTIDCYDGENLVASFRGYTSFNPVS